MKSEILKGRYKVPEDHEYSSKVMDILTMTLKIDQEDRLTT